MTVLVAGAVLLHWAVAEQRSAGLLAHDEAISLLASAGKSQRIDELYEGMRVGPIVCHASDLQDLLRPTSDVKTVDVVQSLSRQDIHPPLYFLILHGMARLWGHSEGVLRLFGSAMFFVAAGIANRWIWPEARGAAKWLGTAWLLATPAMVDIATELRQYALVYLGVVIGMAAMVMLWEERKPARHTLMLLALSPVILLWTQFGMLVWVATGFLALAARTIPDFRTRWKLAAGSVAAASVLLTPLLLWSSRVYAVQGRPAPEPLRSAYAEAIQPLSAGLVESWCWLPWTWRLGLASPVVAVAVIAGLGLLLWRRGRSADWTLWIAGVGWGIAWLILLVLGRVPPHAVEPKQLAPLALVPVCLIVRAASRAEGKWSRYGMAALLAVSVGSLSVRTWQMLKAPRDASLLAALAEADCLVTDAPKRGYLLPLAEQMRPDALVIAAPPQMVLDRWPWVSERLPDNRLLLAEMGQYDGRRAAGAKQLSERLARTYGGVRVLRRGPRRTVTQYSDRRDAEQKRGG
jgi:hypothetical protein